MAKGPKNITTTTQNKTTIDPTLQQRQNDLWGQATGLPQNYTPYTDPRFEDFNKDQNDSFDLARQASTAGSPALQQAIQQAGLLGGYTPSQVGAPHADTWSAAGPQHVDAPIVGSGLLGGGPSTVSAGNTTARRFTDSNISDYMNPFIGNVVDSSLGDIERARKEAISNGRAGAISAGAFGGARHGVSDSLTNRDALSTAASTSAGLRKAGFDAASGLITSDDNRDLASQQGNQQTQLAASAANGQNSVSSRDQLLRLLQGNQSAGLTAGLANASNASDIAKFNASQGQQAGEFNATNDLTASSANAQNGIAGAGLRLNAAGMLGNLGSQYQGLLGSGADLLNRVGGQQQQLGQAKKDFQFDQWNQGQQYPFQRLQFLQGLLGGQQYGTNSTQTQTAPNPNRGSILGTVLGGASTIAGLGGFKKLAGLFGGGQSAPEEMAY